MRNGARGGKMMSFIIEKRDGDDCRVLVLGLLIRYHRSGCRRAVRESKKKNTKFPRAHIELFQQLLSLPIFCLFTEDSELLEGTVSFCVVLSLRIRAAGCFCFEPPQSSSLQVLFWMISFC